jgi:hypothetical protein
VSATPCDGCGRADYIDGDDPSVHWDAPGGAEVAASSCSEECSRAVEATRGPDGRLDECALAGEHLRGQPHRWQECAVYHGE